MRYLTFIKGEQTPAVGVLLSDSLHVLDLSHVSCSDIIGRAGSNLLEMVIAGLPSITKKITSKIESSHYDQAAVVSLDSISICSPSRKDCWGCI